MYLPINTLIKSLSATHLYDGSWEAQCTCFHSNLQIFKYFEAVLDFNTDKQRKFALKLVKIHVPATNIYDGRLDTECTYFY